ncbi:MAG TPA: SpaA isopeptide-forming pilin-related protein, partial [Gemmatimonadales bacterium]|nr:SpaA isopeptide-forming pilin-related protein [Gemmatimonadales bacterium]
LNGTAVTVTTDGSGDNSSPAFKVFVDGTLDWLKHDGSGSLLAGAVFTVCRLEKWNSDLNNGAGGLADTTDVCFDVSDDITAPDDTDAPPGDRDGTGGEFKLGGLLLGKYSVKEKTAPTGYILDPDSAVVTLSTTSDSVKIATAFVNILPPILKITKIPDAADDQNPDGTVHPGGTAVFKVTVKNDVTAGGATATGVSMTDTLPAGLTWTDDKNECVIDQVTFGSPSATHDRVICTIGDLDPQESFTVTLSAAVPNNILQIPPSPTGTALEIDGNLTDEPDNGGANDGNDWASLPDSLFKCTGNPATSVGCAADRPTGRTDNSFGQGTKEDTQVPKVVSGSIPNNKSDLLRFYVSRERFGSTDFLYLAWSRVQEPSGTTNMDFELNQSKTLSSNHVTPVRTAGDILVRYDLAQGGTVPVLGFHRWITSGPASNCEASNALPCWDKFHALNTDVKGAINSGTIPEPIAGGNLSPRTFGEASIDLPASGIFQTGVCANFASAYLKSRSSASFGSELKDFIAPITANITNCAPVTLNNKAWAEADNFTPSGGSLGDPISDTGKIEVTEDTSASLPVDGASVQFARKPEPVTTVTI